MRMMALYFVSMNNSLCPWSRRSVGFKLGAQKFSTEAAATAVATVKELLYFVIDKLYLFYIWFLPLQAKSAESKKAKKDKPADGDSDEEEVLDDLIEGDSEIESDEYDVPYDGEEDDIECDGKLFHTSNPNLN